MKPILKWAGGKGTLVRDIKLFLPEFSEDTYYHEPFFGGGALFFELEPKKGTINDINERLINFYRIVKKSPEKLIDAASEYQKYVNDKDAYYDLREEFNSKKISKLNSAALFLYFNKTSYNGLYRENSSGQFNVPIGRYKNPVVVNKKRIRNASKLLKKIKIYCRDYEYVFNLAKEGDICYLDPPYYQENMNNKFTNYSKNGFTFEDHVRLKKLCEKLNDKGVFFILSNSNTKKIVDIFEEAQFDIGLVTKKWMISCNASSRKNVKEILVHNISFSK